VTEKDAGWSRVRRWCREQLSTHHQHRSTSRPRLGRIWGGAPVAGDRETTEERRWEERCNGGAENNSQRTTTTDLHHDGGGFGLREERR